MTKHNFNRESAKLLTQAQTHLAELCLHIPNRRVGNEGNRQATDYFAQTVASFAFAVACPEFDCMDWRNGGARLTVAGESFEVFAGPYSLGGQIRAPLAVASTVAELEAVDATDKIILLAGELTQEQLMPKNFPFYNPEHHRRIIHLLETKQPRAIVAATGRNPELAGGRYPFPLIEDGDFDIPSVYMTAEEGDRLVRYAGQVVSLDIDAERIPATGCNVIARAGQEPGRRLVICAHIDAKIDTPGAIDNAGGVVVLLLLAELLTGYKGKLGLEIVALNGEDYYAASGEIQYVSQNANRFDEIVLAINLDAAGYRHGQTAYSLYNCPPELDAAIRSVLATGPDIVEGEPWYQSDHSIFIQQGRPAMALTSDRLMELSTYVTHTPADSPEIVDCAKLVDIALTLRDVVLELERGLRD